MKVLFVTHYWSMMGANRSMLQLILELRQKGVEAVVLGPRRIYSDASDLKYHLDKEHIECIVSNFHLAKGYNIMRVIGANLHNRLLLPKAIKQLSGNEFDLVHSNSSVINFGDMIARKLKIPHVWHLREFGDIDYGLRYPFGKIGEKYLYRGKNTFIAISEIIKRHFSEVIPGNKIKVIYNGIKVQPGGADHHNDRIQFCQVGLITYQKNQEEVLRACKLLVDRGIRNFRFSIIGQGDEEYVKHLRSYVSDNSLGEHVTFLGQSDNVNTLLDKMDVGIMPSLSEAFGRVTVEYMMRNLAVIASDTGANPEIITDGYNGLLYPLGNIDKLADKMAHMIENRTEMQQIAAQGRRVAMRNFTSDANSTHIFELYNRILS